MPQASHDADRDIGARWIAVGTHPHRELVATHHLARQGFDTYCPMIRRSVSHARRKLEVVRPLFPGYIFAATDPHLALWRPVLSTVGVRSIVRCGEQPSTIDGQFIQALKRREIDGAIARGGYRFEIGQIVEIARGPFERLIGTIVEMDERARLVVLTDLFNRPVRMTIDPQMLNDQPRRLGKPA